MELEQIREKWQTSAPPSYTREELDSIFQIKQSNVLGDFRSMLKADLIIAELIAFGFIITLQLLDLRTSNFWSLVMGFIGIQHLFIYLLQSVLIRKMSKFNGNVSESIDSTVNNLGLIRWMYRIIPVVISVSLYFIYINSFDVPLSANEAILVGAGISFFILIISETLSSLMVKSHIRKLKQLKKGLQEVVKP